jgi:large subunit ribosomal protein L9
MKVILVQFVDNLGDIGDVIEVANGYGRNYLIPRGLAIAATAKNKRQLEHEQSLQAHRIARAQQDAQAFANELQTISCRFTRKAGEEGKLFGSVTTMDIAESLKAAA